MPTEPVKNPPRFPFVLTEPAPGEDNPQHRRPINTLAYRTKAAAEMALAATERQDLKIERVPHAEQMIIADDE